MLSCIVAVLFLDSDVSIYAADLGFRVLRGHVPSAVSHLSSKGNLPPARTLDLAIGLLPRDEKGLDLFLTQVYDPASPQYRQFLTPDQFADQFGPTAADYERVAQFARANGLAVTKTYRNRLILDVSGSVDNVQKAFRVTLKSYHHPTENRDFFAPDREPSVDVSLPVADIQGLSDFSNRIPG